MKKNSEYIGVDEKFVPEDEMYVDDSVLEKKEKSQKTSKNILIGIICFFGIVFLIFLIMFIFIFSGIFSTFDKVGDNFDKIGNNSESIIGGAFNTIKEDIENSNSINKEQEEAIKESDRRFFNATFEGRDGTKSGFLIKSLIQKVVTNNKTNSEHIVTVTYKGKTASTEQELVQMKYTLDERVDYEVSLDYDSEGFVSNINIMTIDEVLNKQ